VNTRKLTSLSLMVSIAIVLSIIESSISAFFFIIPGVKLGLANIVTLVVLYLYGRKEAFIVMMVRILLVGLIYSGLFSTSFWISLSGGIIAITTMVALSKTNLSIYSISVAGALMHMVGQIFAAIILLSTQTLLYYLPIMIMLSVPTGIITAYLSKKIINNLSGKILKQK
jgi:heptaprenyl diphosphate synthase